MKMAKLHVSPELILAVLMLPEGVTVTNVQPGKYFGSLELTLTGDELPVEPIEAGQLIPEVIESITATIHDCGHRTLTAELCANYPLTTGVDHVTKNVVAVFLENPAV